jgi:hypothetical protein
VRKSRRQATQDRLLTQSAAQVGEGKSVGTVKISHLILFMLQEIGREESGMSNRNLMLWLFTTIGLLFTLGAGMNAYAVDGESWKEEVLLHDGHKLIVERLQTRGGRHEIGQEIPIAEHKISFALPGTHETVTWNTNRGLDTNESILILLALDVIKGVPYIVTHPAGSVAYKKWGSPNPPYVFFKYDEKTWQRISIDKFPEEIKEANVVIGILTHARRLDSHSGIVSAEEVKKINEEARNPSVSYLRQFVRAPLDYGPPRQEHKGPKAPNPISPPSTPEGQK